MSNPEDKTAAQTLFLGACKDNPTGPPPQDWPAPGNFRRWLKKESFRKALASIRDALRFQADPHVATAAAQAAKSLQAALPAAAPLDLDAAAQLTTQLKAITDLLRLAHLRQRFPADAAPAQSSADPSDSSDLHAQAKLPAGWGHILNDPNRAFAAILNDPKRLKGYMLLAARNTRDYDQFLVAFPEELKRYRGDAPDSPTATPRR